jgi:hypothetical protein
MSVVRKWVCEMDFLRLKEKIDGETAWEGEARG